MAMVDVKLLEREFRANAGMGQRELVWHLAQVAAEDLCEKGETMPIYAFMVLVNGLGVSLLGREWEAVSLDARGPGARIRGAWGHSDDETAKKIAEAFTDVNGEYAYE